MAKIRWKIAQWFERKWWKNYLHNKSTSEYLAWKKSYWKQLLEEISITDLQEPILDLGCGPAGIFTIVDQPITALDPLIPSYEKELEVFQKELYPNVTFLPLAVEDYKFTAQFNTIFCLNAINHFENLDRSLTSITNGLTTNGKLILSIDAHNYSFFKYLFRWIPMDILHPYQFNLKEYQKMLLDRHFSIDTTFLKKKDFFFNYYVLVATKK